MAGRRRTSVKRFALAGAALALAAGCLVWASPLMAAGPLEKLGTSLGWVPDNAAFYSSMLRNGEQVKAIGKSRAWAAVKALPAVQEGLKQLEAEMGSGHAAQFKAILENPEVRKALDLLADMFSNEVFLYADPAMIDFLEVLQISLGAGRYGPAFAQMGGMRRRDAERQRGMMVLSALAENPDLIKVPNLLVGFKITDRDLAVQELAKLEGMLNMLLMFQPQLSGQFKRAKVGSDEFLTLTLTGEMIPWDVIPLDNLREQELEKGDVDKVVGKVKKLTQVIALGLHKDYLIFASGPSTELLARLGQAKPLSTRPEFKPLQKYADRRLVGIDYLSEAMAARLSTTARDIDDLAGTVKDLVSGVELSQQQKDQIGKDVEELAKDLKGMLPKPGAMMGFQFLVDQGMEGYTYQWAENPNMVANQPLSLLQHVGGGPILAAVGRSTSDVAQYELLAKWAQRAFGYFEQFALPQMSPDEREQYAKAMEAFKPLLKRWDEANRTLIRATADGQIALVVDAQLKSRQFCRQMPELPRPMPMIEPAVVLGVSDSERMRKAMGEYRAVFNEGVEALRKVVPEPDEIPPLAIPEPKVTKTAAGTLYSFPFPEQWGIAKEIVPTLGLSEKVGVAAATTNHAGRLLTPTPLSAGGVLADANRPRGMAVSFDWAGLVDAASPWVEYAVRQVVPDEPEGPPAAKAKRPRPKRAPGKKAEAKAPEAPKAEAKVVQAAKPNAPKPGKPAIMPQVRTVLNVLKCLRSITSETYREGDALVTHTLVEVRDLD